MNVPSDIQFTEAMQAIATPLPVDFLEGLTWSAFLDDNQSRESDLASELVRLYLENWNRTKNLPAVRWLDENDFVALAKKNLFRGFRTVSTDEYAHHLRNRLILSLRKRHIHKRHENQLRWLAAQEAIDQLIPPSIAWRLGLLWALREYHHDNSTLQKFVGIRTKVQLLERKALVGIQALQELESLVWAVDDYRTRPTTGYGTREVESLVSRALEACPVKRFDGTARERFLVYRLWQTCLAIRLGHRASRAISYILSMRNIENQIDGRSIERMCAEFKHRRRGRSMPTRRLFAELRGDKYREDMRHRYDESLQEERVAEMEL